MFSGLIRFRIVWQEHFTDGTILRGTPGTVYCAIRAVDRK